jgi:molecular chaperone GrpE (heat shock protein)
MNRFINNLRNGYKYKLIPLVENSESIIPYKFKLIIKNTKRKKDKPPKEKDTPEEIIKNFREHRKKYKRLLKKFKNFKKEQENKFTEYKEYKIIEGMDVKGFVDEKLKALDILRCNKIKRNEDLTFVDGVIEGLNKIKKYISILQVEKEDKNPMLTVTTGEPPIIRSQFKFGNGTWRNINENK